MAGRRAVRRRRVRAATGLAAVVAVGGTALSTLAEEPPTVVVSGAPSVALDLMRGDDHRFVLLWAADNGVISEIVEPGVGALNEFVVDSQREIDGELPFAVGTGGDYASLPLVAYRGGELWTVPGARIVAAVPTPIEGWCEAWPSHAVELAYEGSRYFAALTEGNCGGSFDTAGPQETLEDFVATFASTRP